MSIPIRLLAALAALLWMVGTPAHADEVRFKVLHAFDVSDPATGASSTGSIPDSRPAIGKGKAIYGMTSVGGVNGTGVIYRYHGHRYDVLHTFGAVDENGANADGAFPGVALTVASDGALYGMAQFGGANGTGTIFKLAPSGSFTVLHTFGAIDANGFNDDGASPLRTIVVGDDGNLYGTTRVGGHNGLGVAWSIRPSGAFKVIRHYTSDEGHAASLLQGRDGFLYGCGVWPEAGLGSGTLYRMDTSGGQFHVLYRFSPVDANGSNADGAECYEPFVESAPGQFVASTTFGGPNGTGVVFRYSLAHPNAVTRLHAFGATNGAGQNVDGANPQARLTLGDEGDLYSTASGGGANGSGVVFRIKRNGSFQVLHTFSSVDPVTGSNADGSFPDFGIVPRGDNRWIGAAGIGGQGSAADGFGNGTLYRLKLRD
jgi:uncharacterized repeat protein (TIGR03803 family)